MKRGVRKIISKIAGIKYRSFSASLGKKTMNEVVESNELKGSASQVEKKHAEDGPSETEIVYRFEDFFCVRGFSSLSWELGWENKRVEGNCL